MPNISSGGVEVAAFGGGYITRDVSSPASPGDWSAPKTIDELGFDLAVEIRAAEQMREARIAAGPRQKPLILVRGERNIEIAAELGFTGSEDDVGVRSQGTARTGADTLAQRLNDRGSLGTVTRVSEERFDEIAGELGMDPEELRARFRGEQ